MHGVRGTDSTRSPIGTPRCGGDCGESTPTITRDRPRPPATASDRPRPLAIARNRQRSPATASERPQPLANARDHTGAGSAARPLRPVTVAAQTLSQHARLRRRFLTRWDFAVLDTEDKGKGLFAQHAIPEGAYLFDYEGETLDLPAYQSRYPDKVSDYAVGVKMPSGVMRFLDAANPRKSGLARFMNHDRRHANVRRATALLARHPAPLAPPAPTCTACTTCAACTACTACAALHRLHRLLCR